MTVLLVALTWGCGSDDGGKSSSEPVGSMTVKVGGPAGVQLSGTIAAQDLFDPTHMIVADCMEKPYPLPGDGSFCDNLLVLPPGLYEVVVQPNDPNCRTEQPWYKVPVQPGQTVEIEITIICGQQTGGLDVIVTEEYGPVITDIDFSFVGGGAANKYICFGSAPVQVTVTVTDQDTPCAALLGTWAVVPNVPLFLQQTHVGCQFTAVLNTSLPPGVYNVTFTVTDGQHPASITFPIHIITCPPPPDP